MGTKVITRADYEKISLGFRNVSSRLLRSRGSELVSNMKRFINYINETPLIKEFIDQHNVQNYDIGQIYAQYLGEMGQYILPVDPSEEISFIYQLISFHVENNHGFLEITRNYGLGSAKIQDSVDEFTDLVIKPLIDHIVSYLGEVAIDMGFNKQPHTEVNVAGSGQQINIANNQSNITATQNVQTASANSDIDKLIEILQKEKGINQEEREEAIDLIKTVDDELKKEKPRKWVIEAAKEKLSWLAEVVTDTAAKLIIQQLLGNWFS